MEISLFFIVGVHCAGTNTQQLLDTDFIPTQKPIELITPADNSSLNGPFIFQWSTRIAPGYIFELSTSPDFKTNAIRRTVTTEEYTLANGDTSNFSPGANKFYWRVSGTGRQSLNSKVGSFQWSAVSLPSRVGSINKTYSIAASGGVPPYTYVNLSACGQYDSQGNFTAPASPCTATLKATDLSQNSTTATVNITTYLNLIQATPGIANYFRLNETGATVTDIVGGKVGNFVQAGTGAFAKGTTGAIANDSDKALRLNTQSPPINDTNSASVDFSGNWFNYGTFSIEAWIKDDNTNPQNGAAGIITNGNSIWALERDCCVAGKYQFTNEAAAWVYFPNLQWVHFVGIRDTVNLRTYAYLNGVLVASYPITGSLGTYSGAQNVSFGRNLNGCCGGRQWQGYLDEVAFYTTALTAQQVLDHYNVGIGQ